MLQYLLCNVPKVRQCVPKVRQKGAGVTEMGATGSPERHDVVNDV